MLLSFLSFIPSAYAQTVKNATTTVTNAVQNATTNPVTETVLQNEVVQTATKKIGLWTGIMEADPLVKLTLLILVGFSIACWAIIFLKTHQLKNAQKNTLSFWQKFASSSRLSEILATKSTRQGPLYEIFVTGQTTLNRIKQTVSKLSDHHRTLLMQKMSQSREDEIYKLEQYVGFLATTASVCPFIGLFGTVWGILTAFMAIGQSGSSSLATVGPYIAEALVATAIGLFAAIPAVIAYNYFVHKIKTINKMIDLFVDEFVLKSEQETA